MTITQSVLLQHCKAKLSFHRNSWEYSMNITRVQNTSKILPNSKNINLV